MAGVRTTIFTILAVAVFAWALLFAGLAVAQEDTTEETTVLAADAADRKVEAETDNVSVKVDNGKVEAKTSNTSVEVDNGEVSVSTDDGSSSGDGTGQQSSLTVQQNQTDEGSGSRASTGDVNIGATRTSTRCQNSRDDVKTFSGTKDRLPSGTFRIDGDHFRIQYTTDPTQGHNPSEASVQVDVLHENRRSTGEEFTADRGRDGSKNIPEGPGTFRLDIEADIAEYDITIDDCRGTDGGGGGGHNSAN